MQVIFLDDSVNFEKLRFVYVCSMKMEALENSLSAKNEQDLVYLMTKICHLDSALELVDFQKKAVKLTLILLAPYY